jgi:hypothetical protein
MRPSKYTEEHSLGQSELSFGLIHCEFPCGDAADVELLGSFLGSFLDTQASFSYTQFALNQFLSFIGSDVEYKRSH